MQHLGNLLARLRRQITSHTGVGISIAPDDMEPLAREIAEALDEDRPSEHRIREIVREYLPSARR